MKVKIEVLEKKQYNETVKSLRQEIKDLEQENAYLNRIIKKLTKKVELID